MSHDYVSTACLHEEQDPGLHDACRQTCKFCDAPCQCKHHARGEAPAPASWVDQARDVARELLGLALAADLVLEELGNRISYDPALFWLRGEEKPPGQRPG